VSNEKKSINNLQAAVSPAAEYDEILGPEELASRLKKEVGWVREKCRTRCPNPLPFHPDGGTVFFIWGEVFDWVRSQTPATEKRKYTISRKVRDAQRNRMRSKKGGNH
jgi:hypothetical protein